MNFSSFCTEEDSQKNFSNDFHFTNNFKLLLSFLFLHLKFCFAL